MPKINNVVIRNILVVRNDRFGEFLLNIPAIKALKETFMNAKITLVVDASVKELIEDCPCVDEIIIDNFSRGVKFLGILALSSQFRKQKFDLAVMLNPSKFFNYLTFLAGIPIRIGYDKKSSFLLTHKIADKKYEGLMHEVENNLALVGLIGAGISDKAISLPLRDSDSQYVDSFLVGKVNASDKVIVIHPWSSNKAKQWPLKNYIRLINLLVDNSLRVIIIGGKENCDLISDEHFNNKEAVLDLVGKLNLRQSSALFRKVKCLVSGDSGPVHLAAASNLKTLVLFRGGIPAVGSKRWGPWGKGHVIIEKENLSDISVEEVYEKILEII